MTTKKIKQRLEYLRKELRAERISYSELAELQSLAEHIEEGDVELLQAAGVEEKPILKPICSWCSEPILPGQPLSKSYDGEVMHFGCAAQSDDADIGDCSC